LPVTAGELSVNISEACAFQKSSVGGVAHQLRVKNAFSSCFKKI
jgi:hypothetical protein